MSEQYAPYDGQVKINYQTETIEMFVAGNWFSVAGSGSRYRVGATIVDASTNLTEYFWYLVKKDITIGISDEIKSEYLTMKMQSKYPGPYRVELVDELADDWQLVFDPAEAESYFWLKYS